MKVVISSGHGLYVRGASGILDEVDEARKVTDRVAKLLRDRGVGVDAYHDNVSKSQSENLERIVDFHNSKVRDIDISVHFNAFEQTSSPRGCEVWYYSQSALACQMSAAMAEAGQLIDRGGKKSNDLYFLSNTEMPSLLLEVAFVDSEADCDAYAQNFERICDAIADVLGGEDDAAVVPPDATFVVSGECSYFGGPEDTGVSSDEGLAFIYDVMDAPHLFLPFQPEGTTGLARRLNPFVHYVACRWDYGKTPKASLLQSRALVRALRTGISMLAFPADWGPHGDTGRVADLSPSLMDDLGIDTDDEVEVIFPWEG